MSATFTPTPEAIAAQEHAADLIPFTQFLRPDGRKAFVTIKRPSEIASKAKNIIARGYRFECEHLSTGDIILTISTDRRDCDIETAPNGPAVAQAVDRLVVRFFASLPNVVSVA